MTAADTARRVGPRAALALLPALAGCLDLVPGLPPMGEGIASVQVEIVGRAPIDAVLPTDLVALPGGGVAVLDGYAARLHLVGPDGTRVLAGEEAWGRPVRAIAHPDGGWWLADPGDEERPPALVAVGADGAVREVLHPLPPGEADGWDFAPTALLLVGDALVVGDRAGRIAWLDPTTGLARRVVEADVDGQPLLSIADLFALPDGGVGAVDTLGARVHALSAAGEPASWVGQFGLWVERMMRPKGAVATGAGHWVVADSGLGAVQLFDPSGPGLGIVATAEGPIAFEHPIAVRRDAADPELLHVLDAAVPELVTLRLTAAAEAAARANLEVRHLRHALRDPSEFAGAAGTGGRTCLQCHDGFVNDTRENWDPTRDHHPVDLIPEREIPSFFPLSEDGRLVCESCHSPHGAVDAADAAQVGDDDARAVLLRHPTDEVSFTRIRAESAELCAACHGDAAHEQALRRLSVPGGAHPVGEDLERALAERGDLGRDLSWGSLSEEIRGACTDCHMPQGAEGEPLLAATDEGRLCLTCHDDKAVAARNHPTGRRVGADVHVARRAAKLVTARDGGVMCRTCHDLVGGEHAALLRRPDDGGLLCLSCHDDRMHVPTSPHASAAAPGQPIACLGCHDVHGGPADHQFLVSARAARAADPAGCLDCHGGRREDAPAIVTTRGHAVGVAPGGPTGELPVHDGKISCSTCHEPHLDSPAMLRGEGTTGPLCTTCHEDQASVVGTDHDGQVVAVGEQDGTCVSCHAVHDPSGPLLMAPGPRGVNPASARCLACHDGQDGTDPGHWTHPQGLLLTAAGLPFVYDGPIPYFAPDGTRTEDLSVGEITCLTCHDPHLWKHDAPGERPGAVDGSEQNSFLRDPEATARFCGACHGLEGRPYLRFFHRDRYREAEGTP